MFIAVKSHQFLNGLKKGVCLAACGEMNGSASISTFRIKVTSPIIQSQLFIKTQVYLQVFASMYAVQG